jgi:hypothetical protein
MTDNKFIVISSKYKNIGSESTTNFTFSIGQSIEIHQVAIKSVSIPNVQYNITVNNNKLVIYHSELLSEQQSVVSLPVGQYDIATLISSLTVLISDTISEQVTIEQSPLTNVLTITTESKLIKFGTNLTTSPLSKVIGLPSTKETYPEIAVTSIVAPNMVNLGGLKNYYLTSRVLSGGHNAIFNEGYHSPLVSNIPIDVPYGAIQHFHSQEIELTIKKHHRMNNIQLIDVKILDEDLNLVDLNGHDIEIILKIYTNK